MNTELAAQMRTLTGKGPARRLREDLRVPAVLYGPKAEPMALSVSAREMEKLLRDMGQESKLLSLDIQGDGEKFNKQVLIREVQVHPYRRKLVHIDFYEVPLDHPIVVDVPIELKGESIGVKKGGSLDLLIRTLSVRCLPSEIPDRVYVDVTALDMGGSIRVSDLVGKVSFELMDDPHHAIVSVSTPEGQSEG